MTNTKMAVGVIGCGNISNAYFKGGKHYSALSIVACADLDEERAKQKAQEHGIRAVSIADLLKDPEIGLIINLTIPAAHAPVDMAILEANKHVYSEKPLALRLSEAAPVLELARAKKLRVACAADTFLGGGIQTCRKLIDDGAIGQPTSAVAFFGCAGHESWHPSPAFYYQAGGGPLLDMGPYYLGALVNLLGPVRRVSAVTNQAFAERTITSKPLYGTRVKVEVPTHVAANLEFENGAAASMMMSFDVVRHSLPRIEIYGTEGALSVPDPNTFGGPVRIAKRGSSDWEEVPLTHAEGMRGAGAADLVQALKSGRAHRASGELAYHLLDIMESAHVSGAEKRVVELKTRVERPSAVPTGLPPGELD
ncbi:MAG: Gfo/Idh/MocA family oxidoreductase [Polyangiaceae bacterium]|nr:Gfo/Idh/MocA family oxidoreductase [Polyangiaceae bacterium]